MMCAVTIIISINDIITTLSHLPVILVYSLSFNFQCSILLYALAPNRVVERG